MMVVLLMHRMFKIILIVTRYNESTIILVATILYSTICYFHVDKVDDIVVLKNISRNPTLSELEQLPNIKNFASVDEYLDMESDTLQKEKYQRDAISVREYYCYKLQMRNDDEDNILHTRRLLQ
ncbi:hypothetical protein H5410_026653 [Solanum commersonii]|uniref:Uncharacterized protein n=1 Tax=Solanum commersonii TaxID=4109 RepID=A0A9J5YX55_SOLCO|nr:hypothetical protein H5410_026653 [Solanum commersonii]